MVGVNATVTDHVVRGDIRDWLSSQESVPSLVIEDETRTPS